MYETECLLIGQDKRNGHGLAGQEKNVDLQSLLQYHDQFIYPTDYQLLRIIHLAMILSGTLFEMLKIYSPEQAKSSQAEYSSVDDEEIFAQAGEDQLRMPKENEKTKKKK